MDGLTLPSLEADEAAGTDEAVGIVEVPADTEAHVTDRVIPLPTTAPRERSGGHLVWVDLRGLRADLRRAVTEAAVHQRVDALVSDRPDHLDGLPPTVSRVLITDDPAAQADIVVASGPDAPTTGTDAERGVHVVVSDAESLTLACSVVRRTDWTLLTFTDPTKIPLEIVIAAAEGSTGRTVTVVDDLTDAAITKLVLEHGSDGVLLRPTSVEDVARIADLVRGSTPRMPLAELIVEGVEHIGIGERACIDTCSLLEPDEGVLVGSFAHGLFLSCSETHPLPYMPTRPFRWNAAAVHSYVLCPDNRTRYISELRAGMAVLAVRVDGTAREVRVGRVKIERRPLISINARTADGALVNLIAQDDWHVRLLGPGGSVDNVTELRAGDRLCGLVPTDSRHVGLPITEFCDER